MTLVPSPYDIIINLIVSDCFLLHVRLNFARWNPTIWRKMSQTIFKNEKLSKNAGQTAEHWFLHQLIKEFSSACISTAHIFQRIWVEPSHMRVFFDGKMLTFVWYTVVPCQRVFDAFTRCQFKKQASFIGLWLCVAFEPYLLVIRG